MVALYASLFRCYPDKRLFLRPHYVPFRLFVSTQPPITLALTVLDFKARGTSSTLMHTTPFLIFVRNVCYRNMIDCSVPQFPHKADNGLDDEVSKYTRIRNVDHGRVALDAILGLDASS